MEKVEAVLIRSRGKYEVRCGRCGKLLCKIFSENFEKAIDKSKESVIIVTRCTRNDCKTDNYLSFPIPE